MSTTRHHINRRRRMAAAAARPLRPAPASPGRPEEEDPRPDRQKADKKRDEKRGAKRDGERGSVPAAEQGGEPAPRAGAARRAVVPLLAAASAVLVAFGLWAAGAAERAADVPAADNTALTDTARTGEVAAAVSAAVAAAFSYDHADPEGSAAAAAEVLTGQAAEQHRDLLGQTVARGPEEKLVLRTAVTHSGVEVLRGDRARVLVFADQRTSRAGGEDLVTGALLAVDAAWLDGAWKIAAIDTFS